MLDEEVKKEIEKFNGLIDEEAARLLVMERMGKLTLPKINELEEGNVSLYAKVESMSRKKNVVKAVIGDETGHCLLNLWHHNVGIARYIKEGDVIRIANAWVREGKCGKEINVGKFGMIEKVDKEIKTSIDFGVKKGIFSLKGILNKKFPTQVYLGDEEHFTCKIIVDFHEIYLLDERAKDIQKFKEGEKIALLWLCRKNGRIYANELSRIRRLSQG